jgi:hypothetical protein
MSSFAQRCTRSVCVALCLVPLLVPTGCYRIPQSAAPQVRGPAGSLADTAQIKPRETTRAEVYKAWGWSDAHTENDRIFIGNVMFSDEKGLAITGPVVYPEGRRWHERSLIIEFDSSGVVIRSYLTRDRVRAITSWATGSSDLPRLDLSKPIELRTQITRGSGEHVWAASGVVVLAPDGLELRSEDRNAHSPVCFTLHQVTELRDFNGEYANSNEYHTVYHQQLKFQGVSGWSSVRLALSSADTVTIVRYFQMVRKSVLPS